MTDNRALEVLKIIHRCPRITPVLIHDKMKNASTFSSIEQVLRTLRETGMVKTLARGIYVITPKGVETLQRSNTTEE